MELVPFSIPKIQQLHLTVNTTKRKQNESEFENWETLSDGGRRYWFDVKGKVSGFARYIKIANSEEVTVSFIQEIYNNEGELTHSHEKYPIDKGHQKLKP